MFYNLADWLAPGRGLNPKLIFKLIPSLDILSVVNYHQVMPEAITHYFGAVQQQAITWTSID